ncbi:hypothetical protein ACYPKM_05520 [Pseudomonas aeruginosa]
MISSNEATADLQALDDAARSYFEFKLGNTEVNLREVLDKLLPVSVALVKGNMSPLVKVAIADGQLNLAAICFAMPEEMRLEKPAGYDTFAQTYSRLFPAEFMRQVATKLEAQAKEFDHDPDVGYSPNTLALKILGGVAAQVPALEKDESIVCRNAWNSLAKACALELHSADERTPRAAVSFAAAFIENLEGGRTHHTRLFAQRLIKHLVSYAVDTRELIALMDNAYASIIELDETTIPGLRQQCVSAISALHKGLSFSGTEDEATHIIYLLTKSESVLPEIRNESAESSESSDLNDGLTGILEQCRSIYKLSLDSPHRLAVREQLYNLRPELIEDGFKEAKHLDFLQEIEFDFKRLRINKLPAFARTKLAARTLSL